jgi:ubiquinone/menaquinone biosynthesis C-methylase UbiE
MSEAAQRQYDRLSRRYDRRWAGYVRRTADLLEHHARIAPGERVLDVGCGTGAFLERLMVATTERYAAGVDVSPAMLAEARRRLSDYPHVDLLEARAEALPFEDGTFDVVVSASVLHYTERPRDALTEAGRVLRAGGRLVLLDWDRRTFWMNVVDGWLRLVDPAHQRAYAAAEVHGWAAAAGLIVRETSRARSGWWPLYVISAYKP